MEKIEKEEKGGKMYNFGGGGMYLNLTLCGKQHVCSMYWTWGSLSTFKRV